MNTRIAMTLGVALVATLPLAVGCTTTDVEEEEVEETRGGGRRRFADEVEEKPRIGGPDDPENEDITREPIPGPPVQPESAPEVDDRPLASERTGDDPPKLKIDETPEQEALFSRAKHAYDEERWDKAIERFRRYVKDSRFGGRSEEAMYLDAEANFRAEKYEAAYKAYVDFLEAFPLTTRRLEVGDRLHQIGVAYITGRVEKQYLAVSVGDRALGRDILEMVVRDYEFEAFADDALFHLAEDSLRKGLPDEAAEELRDLIFRYPQSEWVPIAEFKLVESFLAMSKGYVYDVSAIRAAERQLAKYLVRYPEGDRAKEAEELLADIREKLAQRELGTAEFYSGEPESARVYLVALLREFPDTDAAATAREMLRDMGFEAPEPAALIVRDDEKKDRSTGIPEMSGPDVGPGYVPPTRPDDSPTGSGY